MEKERLVELGRQLGLEKDALREWVERECAQAREEEDKEREFAKENAEWQQKLLEQHLKILELKVQLQERESRLKSSATDEKRGSSMSAWDSRRDLEELGRRIGLEGAGLKVWVEERLAVELAKEQEQIEYERQTKEKENETIKKDKDLQELKTRMLGINLNVETQRREQSSEESSNEPVPEVFSSSIPHVNENVLSGDHVPYFSISPEVLLNPSIEDCRLVSSRGNNSSLHVLDEAHCKAKSKEHGSPIEGQFSGRASGKPKTFEEVGEPLDYGSQCHAENSDALSAYCSGVLLAGLVHDHLRNTLINEGKLEVCRVPEDQQQAIVPTLSREIHEPDANTPELCPISDTSNGASAFLRGVLSTSAHAYPGASMRPGSNPPHVSPALTADRRMLYVDIAGGSFKTRVTLYVSDLVPINIRDAYLWTKLEASHMLIAKQMRSALRFVWDAIT